MDITSKGAQETTPREAIKFEKIIDPITFIYNQNESFRFIGNNYETLKNKIKKYLIENNLNNKVILLKQGNKNVYAAYFFDNDDFISGLKTILDYKEIPLNKIIGGNIFDRNRDYRIG